MSLSPVAALRSQLAPLRKSILRLAQRAGDGVAAAQARDTQSRPVTELYRRCSRPLALVRIQRPSVASADPQHASAARALASSPGWRGSSAPPSALGRRQARSTCLHAYIVHTQKTSLEACCSQTLGSEPRPLPFHSLTAPRVHSALDFCEEKKPDSPDSHQRGCPWAKERKEHPARRQASQRPPSNLNNSFAERLRTASCRAGVACQTLYSVFDVSAFHHVAGLAPACELLTDTAEVCHGSSRPRA